MLNLNKNELFQFLVFVFYCKLYLCIQFCQHLNRKSMDPQHFERTSKSSYPVFRNIQKYGKYVISDHFSCYEKTDAFNK